MNDLPKTRAEALAIGAPSYFNGKPCKNGHVAERLTLKSHCLECKRASARAYVVRKYRSDPIFAEKSRQQFKQWQYNKRKTDPEYLKEDRRKTRIRQAALREETGRAYGKAYDKRNALKRNAAFRNRQALKAKTGGTHTKDDVLDILRLQGSKCAYCRVDISAKFHVDHIVPVVLMGTNDRRNLQCLCPGCNMSKGPKHPLDFARWLGLLL